MGRHSDIKIETNHNYQISGFDVSDVGREIGRNHRRQNADLVRNLRSAVG